MTLSLRVSIEPEAELLAPLCATRVPGGNDPSQTVRRGGFRAGSPHQGPVRSRNALGAEQLWGAVTCHFLDGCGKEMELQELRTEEAVQRGLSVFGELLV